METPQREKTKHFCKKFFVFSLRSPASGASQREKEIFLQKNFFFSLFGF
jgi:hypothetical protein